MPHDVKRDLLPLRHPRGAGPARPQAARSGLRGLRREALEEVTDLVEDLFG